MASSADFTVVPPGASVPLGRISTAKRITRRDPNRTDAAGQTGVCRNDRVGSFVATTGQKPWPSVGSFVAAYGQFFMAADTRPTLKVADHRVIKGTATGTRTAAGSHATLPPSRRHGGTRKRSRIGTSTEAEGSRATSAALVRLRHRRSSRHGRAPAVNAAGCSHNLSTGSLARGGVAL